MINDGTGMEFTQDVFDRRDLLMDGYWQSDRYFAAHKAEIFQAFTFKDFDPGSKNSELAEILK